MTTILATITITITITIFPPPSHMQSIQIHDLSTNPGLISIKDGYSFLKIGNHKLFHIIDFTKYEPIFRKLTMNINGIKTLGNFTELTDLLDMKYSNTVTLFLDMKPRNRNKRGLLNFIGSGIKMITGNLDYTDYLEISQDIQNLRINNKMLITENNKQLKINVQLQDRINGLINQIDKQQSQITKNIIKSRDDNSIDKKHTILKEAFKINFNLDILYHHLENLFEAVQLAKHKIISKHILTLDEIQFAIKELKEHNIIPSSVEQVYEFLELSAFYNQTELIFVVYIPILDEKKFDKIILEPLPVGNRVMKLPALTAMQQGHRTFFIISDCPNVENYIVCSQHNL